jgi:hypothetical protein
MNTMPVRNPGFAAIAVVNNVVGLYTDTGCLLCVKQYSGNWEAKRGAETIQKILSQNPNDDGLRVVDTLKRAHIKVQHYVLPLFKTGTTMKINMPKYVAALDMTLGE